MWADRYPWIVESALRNRHQQFVIDGEAVILGVDGISDFNALHSRQHVEEVQLYAFDILAGCSTWPFQPNRLHHVMIAGL